MRPLEERIAELQKKMEKKLDCGVNSEELNDRYRALLKQKFTKKS
jgi:hypothetical protein